MEEEEDSGGGERSRETSDETCFLPHLQGLERCPAHSRCTIALWTELEGVIAELQGRDISPPSAGEPVGLTAGSRT